MEVCPCEASTDMHLVEHVVYWVLQCHTSLDYALFLEGVIVTGCQAKMIDLFYTTGQVEGVKSAVNLYFAPLQ